MGNLVCGPDNAQGVMPGDYSNPNCWPGAIYCPPAGTPVDEAAGEPIVLLTMMTQLNPRNLAAAVRGSNEH